MNIITYVQNHEQLNQCHKLGVKTIILEHIELARFGKLSTEEFNTLAKEASDLGMQVSCEWDILMTDDEFILKTTILKNLSDYHDIRVQDPGAINYSLENLECPISLILETGNHNLKGVQSWVDSIGNRVHKVILSIELSKDILQFYCQNLKCPVEFLGVGRILLFYTPRNLLSALSPQVDDERKKVMTSSNFLIADGESEESPHKGFPIIENRHGTFMFHIKRLFLLDHVEQLEKMPINDLRLDLRFDEKSMLKQMLNVINKITPCSEFKNTYPYDVIKGYFNVNKTDVIFKKLKNSRIQRKDNSYIGEVIESSKGDYLAIVVKKQQLKVNDSLKFITPEGKELVCKVHTLKNSQMMDIEMAKKDQLCFIQYFGGVWVKSQVYLDS